MKLDSLVISGVHSHECAPIRFSSIAKECKTFLSITGNKPLIKEFAPGPAVRKVKVRHKRNSGIYQVLESVVKDNVSKKFVVCSTKPPDVFNEQSIPYYIFPIDGFQYVSSSVMKSLKDQGMEILSQLVRENRDEETIKSVIRTYNNDIPLMEHINRGNEILLYGITHFYAIDATKMDYTTVLDWCSK